MARPSRRVLIGLSVRLGKSIYEIETWEIPVIREYMAYLMKEAKPERGAAQMPVYQTPDEIAAAFKKVSTRSNED